MNILSIAAHKLAKRRAREIERYIVEPDKVQAEQLRAITRSLSMTAYGIEHRVTDRVGRSMYVKQLPIVTYEQIYPYMQRMLSGERRVLTSERTSWFAKSSGTSNAKSKFIPVNKKHLHTCHYKGGADTILLYLLRHPDSDFFAHRAFALAGSCDIEPIAKDIRTGDLSALLLMQMPAVGRMVRVPKISAVLHPDWEKKLELVSNEIISKDVGNISGVPSWMMLVLREVLRKTGAKNIKEVWSNLEVFFHGGIAFGPYRSEYEVLLGEGVNYQETYNASEGFFGIQDDPSDEAMLLMLDYGVYYEFIPMDSFDEDNLGGALPLHEVEVGKNYAMVISNMGGLYRYLIGDTVQFTSTHPYKFIITGRTKSYINAFGEELMVNNADQAFSILGVEFGCQVNEYTAGPVFMAEESKGYHHWVVEWKEAPADQELFNRRFDEVLKQLNSDYEAKRYLNYSLQPPVVSVVPPGSFYNWMKSRQKLGGQHKVTRLYKDDSLVQSLLKSLETKDN